MKVTGRIEVDIEPSEALKVLKEHFFGKYPSYKVENDALYGYKIGYTMDDDGYSFLTEDPGTVNLYKVLFETIPDNLDKEKDGASPCYSRY